jgi:hypothetical protein
LPETDKGEPIYRGTGKLRSCLSPTKFESTSGYLGIEINDTLAIAQQIDIYLVPGLPRQQSSTPGYLTKFFENRVPAPGHGFKVSSKGAFVPRASRSVEMSAKARSTSLPEPSASDAIYYRDGVTNVFAERAMRAARRQMYSVSTVGGPEANALEKLYPYPHMITCVGVDDGAEVRRRLPGVGYVQDYTGRAAAIY